MGDQRQRASGPRETASRGHLRPTTPSADQATALLDAVDVRPAVDGCTVVRVQLGTDDGATMRRIREDLRREPTVLATTIGRPLGPDAPAAFDVLVVPAYDPATVADALGAVEEVVGVTAATFRTRRGAADGASSGGWPADDADPAATFAALEATVERVPHEALLDELEEDLPGEEVDSGPLLEADGRTAGDARRSGDGELVRGQTGSAGERPDGSADVAELSRRVAALERRVASPDAVPEGADRPATAGDIEALDERVTRLEAELTSRMDRLETRCTDAFGHVGDRLATLGEEVETLRAWRRRTRRALLGE